MEAPVKVKITFNQRMLARHAKIAAGVSPAAMALKPGGRVHRDRRHEAMLGRTKHKNRHFD